MTTKHASGAVDRFDRQAAMRVALARASFGVAAAILVASYAWLALDRGTAWLWNVPVHESGRYTLGGTIFYFGHFLREVPTDIAYALFVMAGAAGTAGPNGRASHDDARGHRRLAWITLMLAGGLVGSALLVSAGTQGWQGALMDLAQMRTRDDLVAYGSHWRFHWLSTLWFGVTAALVVPAFLGRPASAPRSIDGRVVAAWGFFGALTLLFGVSGEVFTDVRFTGHQAREILTHGLITGPLAVGIVMMLRGAGHGAGAQPAAPVGDVRGAGVIGGLVRTARSRPISAALCVVIPLYLAAVTLAGDPLAVGQSDQGLSAMLAGHVFEHALDYLFVLLLVTGGCALLDGPRGLDRQP